jgi:hypothetical protein
MKRDQQNPKHATKLCPGRDALPRVRAKANPMKRRRSSIDLTCHGRAAAHPYRMPRPFPALPFHYPKGVASYSPGLLLPWVQFPHFVNNPKGVASIPPERRRHSIAPIDRDRTQPLQGCFTFCASYPGLRQLWAIRRNPVGIQFTPAIQEDRS